VSKVGGITEMMKVIALAQERGVRVAPHSPYFGPGLIATVHVIAAVGGDMFVERFYCDLEASPLGAAVHAENGQFAVPQGPGLGIDIDEKIIARYRVG
jgi:L-alanine-DL-glutamate epimerase-like enolase superfamily enzyme